MKANAIARSTVRFPLFSGIAQLLSCCSVCTVLLSFVQYLCTGDIEQRTVTQSWQYLGTGDIEQRTVTQSWQYLCTGDIEQRTVTQSWQYLFAFSYHVSN